MNIKKSIKIAVACLIIAIPTLSLKIYGTISNTLEHLWVQYESPYNIHDEFILKKLLEAHRPDIRLFTFGLLDNLVAEKQKELIERVKNKIPPDDDVWIDYWFSAEAKFWPHADKMNANTRIELAHKYLDMLMVGNSKVVQFDKAWRYKIWGDLAYYIANNIYISERSYAEKYEIMNRLISDSESMNKKLDINYLLKQRDIEVITPFIALNDIHTLYAYIIKMQKDYNKLSCNSDLFDNFYYNISEITNMSLLYKSIDFNNKRVKEEVFAVIDKRMKDIYKAKNIISKYCPDRPINRGE